MIPDPAHRACVSADEAFAELGIDRTTGYRAIREGTFPIPVIRIGRLIRVPTLALRRLLDGAPLVDDEHSYDRAQPAVLGFDPNATATRPASDPREALRDERLDATEV